MESEVPPFSRLDPVIDGFVGNRFALKVRRRVVSEASGDDIGALPSSELGDDVFPKVVVHIEFSLPISPSLSRSIRPSLGAHGGIGSIPGTVSADLILDDPMLPLKVSCDLADGAMCLQPKLDLRPFEAC